MSTKVSTGFGWLEDDVTGDPAGVRRHSDGKEFTIPLVETDPVTGGSIIFSLDSLLKLPPGETDLSNLTGGIVSKCLVNSTDQSSRFLDEVLASSDAGVPLILPVGVINLSGLASTINLNGLKLVSPYGKCWLDAGSAKYFDLFQLTGGDVDLYGIGIKKFKRPINSSAALGMFRLRKCAFQQNRGGVTLLDRSDYPYSYAESIVIDDCDVIDSPGFELKGACDSAQITRNRLLRVRRDPTLWDTTGYALYGICLGDHDDVPPEYAQSITRSAVIFGNVINGVTNDSLSPVTTKGICVSATDLILAENIVRYVTETLSPLHSEGIYLKAQYGDVSNNILVDAGTTTTSIAIKGKSYGAPLAKQLRVHHNTVRAVNNDIPVGVVVYGSSADILVENNTIEGFKDGAVAIFGSQTRAKIRNNRAVDCGGIPFYWACGDIVDCENSGNEIVSQRIPTTADRSRPSNPYPDAGSYQMQGNAILALTGTLKAFSITSGGSGYSVNGSANGSFPVVLTGGTGGSGGTAYATIKDGALVSVVPMDQGAAWTVAPSVAIPLASTDGTVISCSGTQASVTTTLSTGKISTLVASGNKIRGSMGYSAANPDANAYEGLFISADDSTSGPIIVDGLDIVDNGAWDAAHPYYIVGLSMSGQPIQVGRATSIRLLGNSSGRRMQPWRAAGGPTLHRWGNFGTRFYLSIAEIDGGLMPPQSTISTNGQRTRLFINFARFTAAASTYLGTILGGQSSGAARITRVTPRFVGPTLSPASGSPTVSVGTASGSGNLIAATAAASLASVTSPVDGTPANDVVSGSTDLDLYLTIAGGSITASPSSVLCIDIECTLTA